jgi:ankyrin repeat protein
MFDSFCKQLTRLWVMSAYQTPASRFFLAIKNNDMDTLQSILHSEPGWEDYRDSNGETVLFSLMPDGAPSHLFSTFIQWGANPLKITSSAPNSPLHWAVAMQRHDLLKIMLASDKINANSLDVRDAHDHTVLHVAVIAGDVDIVAMLVEKGANINTKDKDGLTPLFMSVMQPGPVRGDVDRLDILRILLDAKGASTRVLNERNRDGNTMLHIAAEHGAHATITLLLERGGNRRYTNLDGDTPLHVAAKAGHREAVRALLEHGGGKPNTVNIKTISGNTALHLAAPHRDTVMNRILLENGADIMSKNDDGFTPLALAHQIKAPRRSLPEKCIGTSEKLWLFGK